MLLISATPLRRSVSRAVAAPLLGAVRNLNVHEYISMEMLHNNNIPAPKAYAVTTPEQAETIYNQKRKFFRC
jgi:hypothetical protein